MREYTNEELIAKFKYDERKRTRFFRFLLGLDQIGNVLFLNGSQDETMSSHIGRNIKDGKAGLIQKLICKWLRLLQSKHCIRSLGE